MITLKNSTFKTQKLQKLKTFNCQLSIVNSQFSKLSCHVVVYEVYLLAFLLWGGMLFEEGADLGGAFDEHGMARYLPPFGVCHAGLVGVRVEDDAASIQSTERLVGECCQSTGGQPVVVGEQL